MNDMNSREIDQLGGYAGSSPRALGTDVKEAFIGTGFVGGYAGSSPRALGTNVSEAFIGGRRRRRRSAFMKKALVQTGLHRKKAWTAEDYARALTAVTIGAQKARKKNPPAAAKLWLASYIKRHRIAVPAGIAGMIGAMLGNLIGSPLGQVPRAMPRPQGEHFVGGPFGQATRAMPRPGREHYVGGPFGQVPRAMGRPEKAGEHYIGGPRGQVPRATVPGTTDLYVGQLGYEEISGRRKSAAWKRQCKKQIRRIKRAARDQRKGRKVPAGLLNACLTARKNAYVAKYRKQPDQAKTAKWQNALMRVVQKHGGTVDGPVAVVGDWVAKAFGTAGKVVGKAGELAVRMAKPLVWDLPVGVLKTGAKVTKGVVWDAPKKTFFPGKPKAPPRMVGRPVGPTQVIPSGYYDQPGIPRRLGALSTVLSPSTEQVAAQIARRKGFSRRQATELAARIEAAKNRQRLAEIEQAEFSKLQELEQQAATAEAEAAAAEAEVQEEEANMSIGGDFLGHALKQAKVASLIGSSKEARVAKEVLKTAGEFAKLTILPTKWSGLFKNFQNIYKAAKSDPKGKDKVEVLKEKAKEGDKQAEKVVDILKMGKKVDDQLKAANIVEKELNKEADKKAAAVSGCSGEDIALIGMLPSSRVVISAIPGAEMVYDLAKKGNETMLSLVRLAADLLRKSAAGDAAASATIAEYGKQAKEGNRRAQLFMAASAVAAAGIREEKAKAVASENKGVMGQAQAQAQRIAADPAAKARLEAQVQRMTNKWKAIFAEAFRPLAERQAAGTLLKVAQGQARAVRR